MRRIKLLSLSRRRFLLGSFATGIFGTSRRLLAATIMPGITDRPDLNSNELRCLRAWIDTLLPADEVSPAASELKVDANIAQVARGNQDYLRLITMGCLWLNQQAGKQGGQAFEQLDDSDREQIVNLAEQAPARSAPKVFFERTRLDAFHYYYARPESWSMLNYPGPPQPYGFRDHAHPPLGGKS